MEGVIRPWYRSRLFWLGVPGLVFLVWLSFFSINHFHLLAGDGMSYEVVCEVKSGRAEVFFARHLGEKSYPLSYFKYGEGPAISSGIVKVPPPLTWREWTEEAKLGVVTTALREIKVAFWLLLVAYLFAWQGLLLWWQRRRFRMVKLQAVQPQ